jgi:hypothetical protein
VSRRIEICDVGTLVVARDFEGAPRARRRLLEDQADFLAGEMLLLRTRVLRTLEIAREIQEITELARSVVLHGQQRSIPDVETHVRSMWRRP